MSDNIFANTALVAQIAHDSRSCYIAIIEQPDGTYDLEVEVVPEAEIGGVFHTGSADLACARRHADALDAALTARGVLVYADRDEWEASV